MSRALRLLGILGAVIVAGVVLSLVVNRSPMSDMPECPHDYRADSPYAQLSVPGDITNVPEYHDCQRLIMRDVNGNLQYAALEAVYIRDQAYQVFNAVDPTSPLPRGANMVVHAPAAPVSGKPPMPSPRNAGAPKHREIIGQIRAWGDFEPLGIRAGFDCLVFDWNSAAETESFAAWIVPVGDAEKKCKPVAGVQPSIARGRRLIVIAKPPIGDVPAAAVARWDWSFADSEQFIGVACPSGWCELHSRMGPDATDPTREAIRQGIRLASASAPDAPGYLEGGYDLQYLAKYAWTVFSWPPFINRLSRDGAFGFVEPDPALASHTDIGSYPVGQWEPAATTWLTQPSDNYKTRLNFEQGMIIPTPMPKFLLNEVSLCFSKGENDCKIQNPDQTCGTDDDHQGRWFARVVDVDRKDTLYKCVIFRETHIKNGDVIQRVDPPAGVVRWRWEAADETMWISCPAGCCQVKVQH